MVVAGVGSLVFINETMDRWVHLNILKQYLRKDLQIYHWESNGSFNKTNRYPKHTAHIVTEWLLYNVPKQLHLPLPVTERNINQQRISESSITRRLAKNGCKFYRKFGLLHPSQIKGRKKS